jgi:hypothetical protein
MKDGAAVPTSVFLPEWCGAAFSHSPVLALPLRNQAKDLNTPLCSFVVCACRTMWCQCPRRLQRCPALCCLKPGLVQQLLTQQPPLKQQAWLVLCWCADPAEPAGQYCTAVTCHLGVLSIWMLLSTLDCTWYMQMRVIDGAQPVPHICVAVEHAAPGGCTGFSGASHRLLNFPVWRIEQPMQCT